MKKRYIKKLRKRVQNFKEYTVSTTYGLFGDFGTEGMWARKILADTPQVAVQRYLGRHWRTHKEKHPKIVGTPIESVRRYGKIMVVDNKGYHYYFN